VRKSSTPKADDYNRRYLDDGLQLRCRYTLDELLAQCNPKARRSKRDRAWLDDKPVGRELI